MSVLAIVFPAVLLLGVIASLAGARGTLRRNRLFGIRLPSLLRSDEAWAAGHRAAILPSCIGFAASAIVGVAAWFEPSSAVQPLKILLVAIFVATIIAILLAARRAARAVAGPASP